MIEALDLVNDPKEQAREWLRQYQKIVERELCERSLYYYFRWTFEKIYRIEFANWWHQKVICDALQKVHAGEIKRLLINVPPRYGKSLISVNTLVSWSYALNPHCNFLYASYSDTLATKFSSKTRDIIASAPFQEMWPLRLGSQKAKHLWNIEGGGEMYAVSSGGQVTGFGAGGLGATSFNGCLLIDDPIKVEDANSDNMLKKVIDNFEDTFTSRLNDGANTPIIVIMQRLHEGDLSGHLLSGESVTGEYHHLNLPAIMEKESNESDDREEGQPLCPDKHSVEELKQIEQKNPILYAGQYQQRPAPAEGNIVKRGQLRFYRQLPDLEQKFFSCDLNFKKEGVSNVCFSHYGVASADVYLLGQRVGKWSFTESLGVLKGFVKQSSDYSAILIEDKANGPAMISVLGEEGFHSIVPIKVDTSKVYRLVEVSHMYAAGNVWYPHPDDAPWVKEHINEMLTFPKAKNDDRVDAETQMLQYFREVFSTLTFYDI